MDIDSGIEASQKKKPDIIYQSLIRMGWERICPASFMAFNSTGWSSYGGHWESLGHLHTVQFDCKYKFWGHLQYSSLLCSHLHVILIGGERKEGRTSQA
jgi:hypothetical protein